MEQFKQNPTQPTEISRRPSVPWTLGAALLLMIALYFGAQIIAGLLVAFYPGLLGWSDARADNWLNGSVTGQFVFILIAETLTIAGLVLFLRRYKFKLSDIGFKRPRWRDAGYGLMLYPLYFISFAIVAVVASQLLPGLDVDQEQQIGFKNVTGTLPLALTFISLVILPPLTEELLVRGFLFGSLRRYFKWAGAAIATSLVFAAAHLPAGGAAGPLYIAAIDTFILSMYLCWLREKTGSLWAGILLHALKNGIAFMTLFVFASR